MPKTTYKSSPPVDIFYSDSTFPANDEIGLDCKDPQNVAYTKYNLPYQLYSMLGGFNVTAGVTFQTDDVLEIYFENISTNNINNTVPFKQTITVYNNSGTIPRGTFIGKREQAKLGLGLIEISGRLTRIDKITNNKTIWVFKSEFIKQVAP